MPTLDQLKSILKTYGVSDKSMQVLDEQNGYTIFLKMGKKGQKESGRETQRYPHISPAKDETPAHLTDIRLIKTVGSHDIIQRFHQHIDDRGNIGDKLHDRFQAIERNSGAICSVTVTGTGPRARDVWTKEQLQALTYTAKLQIHEYGQRAVMSKAVMNRYNIGVR